MDKHPVLKGRILNDGDNVFLVCDSYPLVELVSSDDTSAFIKPFDLEDYLARFYIIDTPTRKAILYDIHHIISDATTISIINKEFKKGFNGILDDNLDLGFLRSSYDDFIVKFDSSYESAHRFFADMLSDVEYFDVLGGDVDGSEGTVILPIFGVKEKLENFTYKKGISVGNLFYAVYAYCLSCFTGEDKVFVNIIEHGRHKDYTMDSVGMFARILPLVVDCSDSSVENYLDYVSDLVLNSMENNVYPFRLLASEFNFNSNISFRYNSNLNDMSFLGEDIIVTDYALDTIGEFLCVVNDLEDGFSVTVHHSDSYSEEMAKQFVFMFKEILIQLCDKDNLKDINYSL
nr:condensation domain-containing protein [uncultured Methanobrevibacter sp.]